MSGDFTFTTIFKTHKDNIVFENTGSAELGVGRRQQPVEPPAMRKSDHTPSSMWLQTSLSARRALRVDSVTASHSRRR